MVDNLSATPVIHNVNCLNLGPINEYIEDILVSTKDLKELYIEP